MWHGILADNLYFAVLSYFFVLKHLYETGPWLVCVESVEPPPQKKKYRGWFLIFEGATFYFPYLDHKSIAYVNRIHMIQNK